VGSKSFTIESEIRDGETLLSRARVVLVFFESATQRSVEPPAAYREAMLAAVNA
jgi:acyl-CoA thioester hydrolase